MQFMVPISYSAQVIRKGKRSVTREECVEWAYVDIPTIEDADAPVALEWRDEQDRIHRTRWHDGRHWARYQIRNDDNVVIGEGTVQALTRSLEAGELYTNPLAVGIPWILRDFAQGKRKAFDPADYRGIESSAREEALTELDHKVKNTIVIDGEIWVQTPEPVYVIKSTGRATATRSFAIVATVVPLGSRECNNPLSVYRADRHDDIVAMFGDKDIAVEGDSAVTVYLPESIKYDDEKAAFLFRIHQTLETYGDRLKNSPVPLIRAWCDLKEAVDLSEDCWNDDVAAAIESATESFSETLKTDDSYWHDSLQGCLSRWRARPIRIDDDFSCTM